MKGTKSSPLLWLGCGAVVLGMILLGAEGAVYNRPIWREVLGLMGLMTIAAGIHWAGDAIRIEKGMEPRGKRALVMMFLQCVCLFAGVLLLWFGLGQAGMARIICLVLAAALLLLAFWLSWKESRK